MNQEVRGSRWGWIKHRQPGNSITRKSFHWNPQGKINKGKPKTHGKMVRDIDKLYEKGIEGNARGSHRQAGLA